ncbi:hypothetical protein D3C72_2260370 [compost metagenome]
MTVLLNDPVGVAWLTVELIQLIQIRVSNGVALIGRQTIFSRNRTNDGGDAGIIQLSYPTHRGRGGRGNYAHSMAHDKN